MYDTDFSIDNLIRIIGALMASRYYTEAAMVRRVLEARQHVRDAVLDEAGA